MKNFLKSTSLVIAMIILALFCHKAIASGKNGSNDKKKTNVSTATAKSKKYIEVNDHTNICLRKQANEESKLTGPEAPHFNSGDKIEYTKVVGDYYEVIVNGETYYFPKRFADICSGDSKNYATKKRLAQSDFLKAAKEVAEWYYKNKTPYQADGVWYKTPYCPFSSNGRAKRDCSGFVSIVLQYCGIFAPGESYNSISFISETGKCGQSLKKAGFKPIKGIFPQEDFSKFKPGDILAVNQGAKGDEHHVTIYAGNGRFYDYGGKAPGFKQPVSGVVSKGEMNKHTYSIIWRR
ncbi:MAG: NlpC/P60 family protein [Sodaliphilus sp.]|nr:NlpC/P60 family protein [Sodaliphilus sp.]